MRRDLVVQVIVQYDDFWENFATPFEAESFINSNLDELDLPVMVRLEDMKGNVKWYYDLVEASTAWSIASASHRTSSAWDPTENGTPVRPALVVSLTCQLKKNRQAGLSVSSQ